jgi:hypothetical protein
MKVMKANDILSIIDYGQIYLYNKVKEMNYNQVLINGYLTVFNL